ncbi:VolA/Pla-1 family phospholipase [Alteromonas sp. C1M14]|uniref:VolA/Pla-1 family phospholipase n=1 Tax=Alteromonas sp. C1M14 TaxID=2841567 RepID=UPI001C098A00|nr:VolA/Pla-1 family phospholipase [Alteromonas sp. C1M14]MBU2976956.1 hypothetical protein [Alteromonas sp. C1M14]
MRKLMISTSVALALGLAGCGGSNDTLEDIIADTPVETAFSRIVFDPSNGNLNIPNDILMLPGDDGFFDYTLNIPVEDANDFSDPINAMNVVDGWSTQQPFVIDVETPDGVALDASTLSAGVHLYEATLGLDQSDPDCATASLPSSGCKLNGALQYGEDFVLSLVDDDTISVVPLKPLKAAQGYMLVVTTDLKDSSGKAVKGSTSWELVRQDINTLPLSTDDQLLLQTLVNTLVDPIIDAGYAREDISYVSAFTTQSTDIALKTIKSVMVAEYAARAAAGDPSAAESLPVVSIFDSTEDPTALEKLSLIDDDTLTGAVSLGIDSLPDALSGYIPTIEATLAGGGFDSLKSCSGLVATYSGALAESWGALNDFAVAISSEILAETGALCVAARYDGGITLPYYLSEPSTEDPTAPLTTFWQASCDSGIILASLSDDVLGSAVPGPNYTLCDQIGLADLRVNGEMIDSARNITKFNPLPESRVQNSLNVQVTVPDIETAAALGYSLSEPATGWPVAILMHGITSQKEDMLAISGALSVAGIATIAIDQPLHGERGYDVDGDGSDDINATNISATHFMNLSSLPTARDNVRQSVADLLGLRLGLNAIDDQTAQQVATFDMSKVYFMGVSLGAIAGSEFASLTNDSMDGDLAALNGLYTVQAASLESPGGGLAQFLIESPSFGPLIKGLLLSQASEDFQSLLVQLYDTTEVSQSQLVEAVTLFLNNLTETQLASVESVFNEFAFAAQTVLDAADPTNYAQSLGDNTPVHMMTVVGDGGETNLSDQVIPVTTAIPLSGQAPLANLIGLDTVSTTQTGTDVSGWVRFTEGAHASSLSPTASAATTVEMQTEVATYFATDAAVLPVTNTSVVEN